MSRRGRRSIVRRLFGLVFVVVLAYAAILAVSMADLKNDTDAMTKTYEQLEASLQAGEFEDSIAQIRNLGDSIDAVEKKLNGWQWQVASNLPVISDDVRCLRQIAGICDSLANDALLPVISRAELILGDVSSLGSGGAQNTADLAAIGNEFSLLSKEIAQAREIVDVCQRDAEALPTSHFNELNNLAAKIREVTTQADEAFDALESINPIDMLGDALGDLLPS